jgi:hypothetical protein
MSDSNMNIDNKATRPKFNRPHLIIPVEDWEWSSEQQGYIKTLWHECWVTDPYGSRWVKIETSLSKNRFLSARLVLQSAGLFSFKHEETYINKIKQKIWYVKNNHGARCLTYWTNGVNPDGVELNPDGLRSDAETHTQQPSKNLSGSYSGSNTLNNKKEINNLNTLSEDPDKTLDLDLKDSPATSLTPEQEQADAISEIFGVEIPIEELPTFEKRNKQVLERLKQNTYPEVLEGLERQIIRVCEDDQWDSAIWVVIDMTQEGKAELKQALRLDRESRRKYKLAFIKKHPMEVQDKLPLFEPPMELFN